MQCKDISTPAVVRAAWLLHQGRGQANIEDQMREIYPDAPAKVIATKIERVYDQGYLECGVSTRTSWPTLKGLKLIGKEG